MRLTVRRRWSARVTALSVTALVLTTAPVTRTVAAPTAPQQTTPASTTALTPAQASAQAVATGKTVPVDGATNATDTLTANPDATFTMTRTAVPVRKHTDSGWANLDPTLVQANDGTITTHVTTSDLTLSPGGTGPLVTMTSGAHTLGLSLPLTLPAPTLSGATATYPAVLPGVDLQVTANAQGGFSDVFVVHDATAAANPALKTLTLAPQGTQLSVTADTAGNLTAADPEGVAAFTAPAPLMWDSTAPTQPSTAGTAAAATASPTADPVDGGTGQPVDSSPAGPGEAAHTATVSVNVTGDTITLSPNQDLLTDPDTTYPVYVDPAWQPARGAWASVSEYYPGTNYYNNTPDPEGKMQVGNSGSMWSHTLVNFPINTGLLSGATIQSAQLSITEVVSYSCTPSTVNLYAPSTTLTSSNATWNYWKGVNLGSVVASQTVAHGYNSSCPAAGVGFNVASAVTNAVSAGRTTQTFALTGVNEDSDHNSWKEFQPSSATLSVTYDHAPNKPTGLTISPGNSCGKTVGDGPVSLNAPVSDRDGDTLHVTFKLWLDGGATILNPPASTYPSGSTAVLTVPESTLKSHTTSGQTTFDWQVQVSDGTLTSQPSDTCSFTFDTTRPGQPCVYPQGQKCGAPITGPLGQIGKASVTFKIDPPTGAAPASYLYQLNGGAPNSVNISSNTTITITPTRFTNVLTVTSVSAGQNIGQTATVLFNSEAAETAPDADLTGDGVADLLTVGGVNNLPPGLWLSSGKNTGQVVTTTTNIGAAGDGVLGDHSPTDFNQAQVITGHFSGTGLQDILIYHPTNGGSPARGEIIDGNGDGSNLNPTSGYVTQLDIDVLTAVDPDTLTPSQLVNAGNSAAQGYLYPDLLGIVGSATADDYHLDYYPNGDLGGGFTGGYQSADPLDTPTPTGDMNWNQWTIATTQLPTDTDPSHDSTAMFLWNPTTGALYLWTNLHHDLESSNLDHTQYTLYTSGWSTNPTLTLQAADINNDGIPDLQTVTAGASGTTVTTTYLVTNLTTNPTITAQPSQTLITSGHTWPFNEGTINTTTATATDTTGSASLTATGNVKWNGDDLYSPDIQLNTDASGTIPDTNPTGVLTNNTPLIDTNKSFSIAVWVRPTTAGGVIVSEDGAHSSRFSLYDNEGDNTWRFGMATGDTTAWSYDQAIAYAPSDQIHLGVWTHLVATYDATTGIMALYVNDTIAATATHTATISWPSTGKFTVGDYLYNNTHTSYYAGQISNLQTWNTALTASQIHPNAKQPTPPAALKDFDGDGKADIVASDSSGALWLYPGTNAPGFTTRKQIGTSGWNSMSSINLADIDHDGKPDIVATDTNGNLWLYPNTSTPTAPSLGNRSQIGYGWNSLNAINTADVNGDSLIDLIARDASGNLQLFLHTDNTGTETFTGPVKVGYGWNSLTFINTPDLTGDSLADLIARNNSGNLQLYPNTGANSFTGPIQIPNWNSTTDTLVTFEDLTGDGRPDLIARDTAGNLQLYPNTTTAGATTFGSPTQIGNGWSTFTIAL